MAVANELRAIIDKVNKAIRSERTTRIAVSTVFAFHKPRIFERGLDANNSQIGQYSTKPASVSKKQQARNTGRTYFPGGYSEYKSAVGKNPGFVILRNTDQMYADYGIIQRGNKFGLGFQNKTNYDKSQWMQDKYDKDIFDHSEQELELLAKTLEFEILKAI